MKRILPALIFLSLFYSLSSFGQCAAVTANACTDNAPTVIGNTVSCTTPINDAGRRNFRINNMIAGATYRVSNCGSGFDTQMTIRNLGGGVEDYNDDNGPACTGLAASIDFIPPADGSYRIQLNRFFCETAGTFSNGNIEVTLIADPPPPLTNNNPCNAIGLSVDATCTFTTYTNLGATDSGIGNPGCALYAGGDVWFSVTVPASGILIIDTDTGGITDGGMAIYSGNCTSLTLIECDDDDSGNGLMPSITTTGLTPGSTIFIRVWEYNNDNQGTFDICVTEPPPPCAIPTPINTSACPTVDITPDSAAIGSVCFGGTSSVDLTATYTEIGDTSDYNVDLINYNQPTFDAFAAAATTTVALTSDDRWSNVAYTMPIDFCFYGNTINNFVVGANGVISFDANLANTTSGFSFNNNLPSTAGDLFENAIYGVYHDIDPSEGGTISYGTTMINGCNALVVLWDDIRMWYNANFGDSSKRHTAMIVMYENTNIIEVHIDEKVIDDGAPWNGGNAIVGIQNPSATAAVVAPCRNALDTDWVTNNEAWRFTPSGGSSIANIQWLVNGTIDTSYDGLATINVSPSDTTTYTAQVTYNWCNATTSAPISDDAIVTVGGTKTWNGGTADWNTASNWTPAGIPNNNDAILIPATANDPLIDATTDGLGCTLTIENGATLTQESNSTLTITNYVDVQAGGVYNIEDSASLIQIDDVANTVNGTFNMNRDTNIRANDYVFWSSPVANFNIENISPGTPNGFKYRWLPFVVRVPGPPGPLDYGEWETYNSGPLEIGKGYIVKGPTGHTTTPSVYTATFNGTPNNGDIIEPIERSTYMGVNYFYQPNPGGDNLLVTSDDDNWNLIGNPYPSAISAIDFLTYANNGNISGSVYLWTHGTDLDVGNPDPFYNDFVYNYNVADYIAYNSSGTSSPSGFNGNIGAGQGFFVLMNDIATTNETVTFTNSMRSSAYANDQFYRTSASTNNSDVHRIWLDFLSPSGQSNTTLIAYIDGATNNDDRMFDAPTTAGNGLNLYSLIEDNKYLIQGRQLPFDINDQVPIGLYVTEAGIQTIAINTIEGLFINENQDIFIEDIVTGIIHNLKEAPYTFTSNEGFIDNRLILRYTNNSLGLQDNAYQNGIKVFKEQEQLTVLSEFENIEAITVYDVLGRSLFSSQTITTNRFTLASIKPNNQTLFLKIVLANGTEKIEKVLF